MRPHLLTSCMVLCKDAIEHCGSSRSSTWTDPGCEGPGWTRTSRRGAEGCRAGAAVEAAVEAAGNAGWLRQTLKGPMVKSIRAMEAEWNQQIMKMCIVRYNWILK